MDRTRGRFADVAIEECIRCCRKWLYYHVEYEAFPASGRFYLGVVTEEQARVVTPETAVEVLESLDWYLCGGRYFKEHPRPMRRKGGKGTVFVDL